METKNKNESDLLHPVDLLEKFAEELFGKHKKSFSNFEDIFFSKKHSPSANISHNDKGVVLEMAIPGLDKKDINISLDKNILTVSSKKEENKQLFSVNEFSYNSFSRSFRLNDSLDKESIKSSLKNGILTIEIAKLSAETVKTEKRTIPVE